MSVEGNNTIAPEDAISPDPIDDTFCLPLMCLPYLAARPELRHRIWAACVVLIVVGVLAGFIAGLSLAWVACGGALLLLILEWRDASPYLKRVDYSILVFFPGLFMVVAGAYQCARVMRARV